MVFREFVTRLLATQGIEAPNATSRARSPARSRRRRSGVALLPLPGQPPVTRLAFWLASQECTIDISRARTRAGLLPGRHPSTRAWRSCGAHEDRRRVRPRGLRPQGARPARCSRPRTRDRRRRRPTRPTPSTTRSSPRRPPPRRRRGGRSRRPRLRLWRRRGDRRQQGRRRPRRQRPRRRRGRDGPPPQRRQRGHPVRRAAGRPERRTTRIVEAPSWAAEFEGGRHAAGVAATGASGGVASGKRRLETPRAWAAYRRPRPR